ncbi:dihydroorotate dehydrogenase [Planctomycetes bacterium Pan216]
MDLEVSIGRLTLPNPILVASGTFGYAKESAGFVDFSKLGGIVPKTVTWEPRIGNRTPRIVETASGMLNAIGLDNDGIDHFLRVHLPYLRKLPTSIIANVAGRTVEEYAALVTRLNGAEGVDAIELNLSCPNVSCGIDFAINPESTERVISLARRETDKPLLAKLTPNVTSVAPIAQAAAAGGADGLTLINTVVGTAIDWRRRRPILANRIGGLSGPAIKPIALRIVMETAAKVDLPIIGVGGIGSIDDVMEFLVAGATAVQIGTANFYDPGLATRLVDELPGALAAIEENSVRRIIGTLERN